MVNILEDTNLSSFHHQINQPVAHDGENPKMKLTASEIYKELRLRGYDYGNSFQGILESNHAGKVHLWVHNKILFFNFVWITVIYIASCDE